MSHRNPLEPTLHHTLLVYDVAIRIRSALEDSDLVVRHLGTNDQLLVASRFNWFLRVLAGGGQNKLSASLIIRLAGVVCLNNAALVFAFENGVEPVFSLFNRSKGVNK